MLLLAEGVKELLPGHKKISINAYDRSHGSRCIFQSPNERMEALFSIFLDIRECVHTFNKANFSLCEAANQIGNRRYGRLQLREPVIMFFNPLGKAVSARRELRLMLDNKLHCLFQFHINEYSATGTGVTEG